MRMHEFSHVALIIGSGKTWSNLIGSLLNNNACVFAPVKDIKQLHSFKESHNKKGKLVAELIDIADYQRAETFVKEFITKYGEIDTVIYVFEDLHCLAQQYFSNISYGEFETIINNYIINFFIFFRIVLNSMRKDNRGIFINIQKQQIGEKKAESRLVSFIEKVQMEISKLFSEEVQNAKVKYHHLSLDSSQTVSKNSARFTIDSIMNLCKEPGIAG